MPTSFYNIGVAIYFSLAQQKWSYLMISWAIVLNLQSLYMTLFPLKTSEGKNDMLYCIIKFVKRECERRERKKSQYTLSMLFILNEMKLMMCDRIPMKVLFSLCLQFVCKRQLCYFYCHFQQEFRREWKDGNSNRMTKL